MRPDKVEYSWDGGGCWVESSMVPQVGQYVSIRQITYEVEFVSFAVDYADDRANRQHVANVRLKPADKEAQ